MRPPLTPERQGTVLLAICAAFLMVVLGVASVVQSFQSDAERKYELGRPGARRLVVLLDVSDPPTPDQAAYLEDRLRHTIERTLQPGDLLTVWTLGQSAEGPLHRVARLVRPPRESNPLFQNPRMTLERYEARFARPLHQVLSQLPAARPSTESPIVEAIDALADLPDLRGNGERRLLLVSDLAQHSPQASFLVRQPTFEAFSHSSPSSRLRPNLRGVAVEIFVLPRARQALDVELARRRFWHAYLVASGATSVEIERL